MNENVLISTAIMSALWEKKQKDTLDLLLPFLKYAIGKTTQVGSLVDVEKTIDVFRSEFGYDTIPDHVITIMLKRLSPSILSKKQKSNYRLVASLDEDIRTFEKRRALYREQSRKVGESLFQFLSDNLSDKRKVDDVDSALTALIDFFAVRGICIVRNASLLSLIKNKDGKLDYCIARFILNEYNRSSEIFDYILDMVKGFFVSTAISLQPHNTAITQAKFKNLRCYIDTRIIIDALGLHLPEAQRAALELLTMLKKQKASLHCFEHTYLEITDIINAYKKGISNPYYSYAHLTLEAWDMLNYKPIDVDRYQLCLKNKIEALGITIDERPEFDDSIGFDRCEFEKIITTNMKYNRTEAISADVNSILSIVALRNGSHAMEIEKCGFLFVTSNQRLTCVANQFLQAYNSKHFVPIIADIDLASIVWLKSYSTHPNYPQNKLLENALLAVEPTQSLLDLFFETVDKIKAEGGVTEDEAAILRNDLFCKRELVNAVQGDENALTENVVLTIRDKLKNKYVGDIQSESLSNYNKYIDERNARLKSIQKAIDEIECLGKDVEGKVNRRLSIFVWGIILILVCACMAFLTLGVVLDSGFVVPGVTSLIISGVGMYDMVINRKKWIKSLISRQAKKVAAKKMDVKKSDYERIFGELNIDWFE